MCSSHSWFRLTWLVLMVSLMVAGQMDAAEIPCGTLSSGALAIQASQDEQQNDTQKKADTSDQAVGQEEAAGDRPTPPEIDETDLQRLSPDHKVWFAKKGKYVVVDGEVCLRQGQLEVFACPQGTKEHESVVKVFSPAQLVHVGLLRVGAIPGTTVRFDPEYRAATGPVVDVWVYWEDEEGKPHKTRAQEWVRNTETKKELAHDWIFGGSGFWVDEETGKQYYQAEGGELICVSNFSTATMDLPIESSQSNAALMFEPFTERIPKRGTPVRLVLKPRPKTKDKSDDSSQDDDAKQGDGDKSDKKTDGGGQGGGKPRDLIG